MSPRNTFAASRRSHKILKWLQNGREVRIQDVMEAFDIQYPQARADLKLLEELYGLSTHREGRTKVWTWSGLNPDYVDVATAVALELGAIGLDIFKDTPYGQEIERLVSHCRDRVKDSHQERLERLSKGIHLRRTWLPTEPDEMLEHIETLLDGLYVSEPRWMRARYQTSGGEVGTYVLLPRRLIWYEGRLWLLALDRDVLKLFDVAAFETLERHRSSDEIEAKTTSLEGDDDPLRMSGDELQSYLDDLDDDPETFFEEAFGIFAGNYPVERIHLEVRGPWAHYLRRYHLHPSQENADSPEGLDTSPLDPSELAASGGQTQTNGNEDWKESLHVCFEMGICPEFKSFVMGMIPDVRVHAPMELRDELVDRVREWIEL
jgi:DNA-binding transcriptional ArsR family regulator